MFFLQAGLCYLSNMLLNELSMNYYIIYFAYETISTLMLLCLLGDLVSLMIYKDVRTFVIVHFSLILYQWAIYEWKLKFISSSTLFINNFFCSFHRLRDKSKCYFFHQKVHIIIIVITTTNNTTTTNTFCIQL